MLHQPSGGAHGIFITVYNHQNIYISHKIIILGMASDIAIHAEEILKVRAQLSEIYSFHTGRR